MLPLYRPTWAATCAQVACLPCCVRAETTHAWQLLSATTGRQHGSSNVPPLPTSRVLAATTGHRASQLHQPRATNASAPHTDAHTHTHTRTHARTHTPMCTLQHTHLAALTRASSAALSAVRERASPQMACTASREPSSPALSDSACVVGAAMQAPGPCGHRGATQPARSQGRGTACAVAGARHSLRGRDTACAAAAQPARPQGRNTASVVTAQWPACPMHHLDPRVTPVGCRGLLFHALPPPRRPEPDPCALWVGQATELLHLRGLTAQCGPCIELRYSLQRPDSFGRTA